MVQWFGKFAPSRFPRGYRISKPLACLAVLAALMFPTRHLQAQEGGPPIDDITAKYHFLTPDDTLAILDEEGRLKGYIEAAQPEEESDDFLNYDIVDGSRTKNHVEFRTNRIHGKFFRFSGTVERGKGHEDKDADYFHLTGNLEIVTVQADTGKETVQVVRVTFKSIGKSERPEG
jgi:hypothetical protein